MAAKTPTGTPVKVYLGSLMLHNFKFSDIDDDDTYASGLDTPVGWWANGTDVLGLTTDNAGVDVSTSANGTFKFHTGDDNRAVSLFVLTTEQE